MRWKDALSAALRFLAAAFSFGAFCLQAADLKLTDAGVEVALDASSKFVFSYPQLLDQAGKQTAKLAKKKIGEAKAELKYDDGTQAELSIGKDSLSVKLSNFPASVEKLKMEMNINPKLYAGWKWRFGTGEFKQFPAEKPEKAHLYQGLDRYFELAPPSEGASLKLRAPDYSYLQLTDCREWNWSNFSWLFISPLNKDIQGATMLFGEAAATAKGAPPPPSKSLGKRDMSLSLSSEGVLIDLGPAAEGGRLTVAYPQLVAASGSKSKILEKSVSGRKAVLKYEGGGSMELSLESAGFSFKLSNAPEGTGKIYSSMIIGSEYAKRGSWSVDGSEPKPFPAEKPAKPFLYQGNAKSLALQCPGGEIVSIAIPDYSFQQLQDNREWGWAVCQWQFWVPFNKDAPSYSVKISSGAQSAVGPESLQVDRFGQDIKRKFPDKVGSEDELKADVEAEKAYYGALNPPDFDNCGGLKGSKEKLGLKATGFFHVENKEGKWLLVDPEGNLFFHLGVCCFSAGAYTYFEGRKQIYEWIPERESEFKDAFPSDSYWSKNSFSFHLANMIRKYGAPLDNDRFCSIMIDRVRKWGFNSAGAFSGAPRKVCDAKAFPYTSGLPSAQSWNGIKPLPGVRETFDPFDEATRAAVEAQCAKSLPKNADDPLLIGYFICNEPTYEAIPQVLPALKSLPVKRRLVQFLQERHKTVEAFNKAWGMKAASFEELNGVAMPVLTREASADMKEFSGIFFDEYFKFISGLARKYDPNHMVIGCRLQPGTANNEQLCRVLGKYCDIFSVNYYAYGVDKDYLDRIYKWSGKRPMMLSEFYWSSSSDSGLGPFKDVNSQLERGLAYRNYLEQSASLGYVVGVEWFTLVDQPRTGCWWGKYDGERANTGLIAVSDRPWKTMLAEMTKSNFDVYKLLLGERKPFAFDDPRFTCSGAGAKRKASIARVSGAVSIDGERGEWPGLPPESISGKRLVEGADAGDAEANFRLAWDETNLYVHIDVKDSTPMKNDKEKSHLWAGDCIELFIGAENLDEGGTLQFGDTQVLLGAGDAGGGQAWFVNAPEQPKCSMRVVPKVDGSGYSLEAAIPFAALKFKPSPGKEILFDIGIDDGDGSKRVRQLMWNGIARNSGDRGAWGRAVFGE